MVALNANLRTHFLRLVKRAGLDSWPRPFHNLRASRQTELEESFPSHVVCAWLGNSTVIARKHYLQVTADHFAKAVQNPVQQSAAQPRTDPRNEPPIRVFTAENRTDPHHAAKELGDTGLEPVTPSV